MNPLHYRDMIVRAVSADDGRMLDLIVNHIIDAERAKQILRANGYGVTGLSASATAALVPKVSTRQHAVERYGGSPAEHLGAFLRAACEWDALCVTATIPRVQVLNP